VKRFYFIVIFFLLKVVVYAQQGMDDYKVMSAIIMSELKDADPLSVAVISAGIKGAEKTAHAAGIINPLGSKNLSVRFQVYFLTENADRERLTIIDSISALHLIDYCQDKTDGDLLTDKFNLPFKTVLIQSYPIAESTITKDWKKFYKRYPQSAGIFSFGKVKHYPEDATAIVYY
jgi:hypothetical protein